MLRRLCLEKSMQTDYVLCVYMTIGAVLYRGLIFHGQSTAKVIIIIRAVREF